jgi:hypothetical protein
MFRAYVEGLRVGGQGSGFAVGFFGVHSLGIGVWD